MNKLPAATTKAEYHWQQQQQKQGNAASNN